MTTWRDQPIPGGSPLPKGSPTLTSAGSGTRPEAGPLRALLDVARVHETAAVTDVPARVRWGLAALAALGLIGAYLLHAQVPTWCPDWLAPYLSWGGNWDLVAFASGASGVALIGIGAFTNWYSRVTIPQLYGTWAALIVSLLAIGPALIAGTVYTVLMVILIALVAAAIVALIAGAASQ